MAPLAVPTPAAAQPVPGTTCAMFPANSVFNTDISSLPVNASSSTWKSNMAQNSYLHPDLGTVAQQYGMPINVAPPPTTGLAPTFQYDAESDHPAEGYPIDQGTLIEGGPGAPSGSDRHALIVNGGNCKLYEIYNLQNFTNGQQPQAGSGAVWDLSSNAMRPDGWTSADAAGLPMTPLLLRSDEILAGSITHAIRFTAHCTVNAYIWPASHRAGSCSTGFPPMGARFRLRSSFDISGYSADTQVVLRAFQHYGLILADNGSDWYFGGTTDDWWGTTAGAQVTSELKTIPAAQFDAVDEASLQVAAGSYQATPPTPCLTAGLGASPGSPQAPGTQVTWTGSSSGCPNPRYRFWELDPGARWSMVQDYSPATSHLWAQTGLAGTYALEVDVRDASETTSYDSVFNLSYVVSGCSGAALSANPGSPQAHGTPVTLSGSASCLGTPTYRFWVRAPGGAWQIVRDYSTAGTFTWTPASAGTYSLEVDVRDQGATATYETVANLQYGVS